jgi:nucleotide-binding universal stress UspA family protein
MTLIAPSTLVLIGVATAVLLAIFVYLTIRGVTEPQRSPVPLGEQLYQADVDPKRPLKVLLAIDGSPCSMSAVGELASCRLPKGSAIEVLTAIHSRVPVVPDFPPWAFTIAAAHADSVTKQQKHAPELLEAVVKHLQPRRRHLEVTTRIVEGPPRDVIIREASWWGADRIVLGSHGYGPVRRAVLGSVAAGVAAEAPCSVYIVRPPAAAASQVTIPTSTLTMNDAPMAIPPMKL